MAKTIINFSILFTVKKENDSFFSIMNVKSGKWESSKLEFVKKEIRQVGIQYITFGKLGVTTVQVSRDLVFKSKCYIVFKS